METNSPENVLRVDTCPVCSGRALQALPVPGRWIGDEVFGAHRAELGLSRCAACGLVYVNPRPQGALLGSFYGGQTYECHRADGGGTSATAKFVLGRIRHHAPRVRRLLDYGCGGGFLLREARAEGLEPVGFDIGAEALRACRAQGYEVASKLSDLEPSSFDAIVLHHVLEHLASPDEALLDLARFLSPGGKLFLEVPNAASLRARLSVPWASRRLGFDERYRAYPIHLLYFRPDTLRRLLVTRGFDVSAIETYGLGLDELFYREQPPAAPSNARSTAPNAFGRKVRDSIKRIVFGAELGENLLAVAIPGACTA